MIKIKLAILIGLLVFFFCGCEKENNPCDITKEGENYMLSDSAKTYVNNYTDADRIIFENSTGDEVSFIVIEKDTIVSYSVPVSCEVDTLQGQSVSGTSQFLGYSLINDSITSKPLIVSVLEFPEIPTRQAQEALVISFGDYLSNSFGNGDLLLDLNFNIDNPQLNYLDSIEIAGKTFYSVYEPNYPGYIPNLEIKYSTNEGVIYIKDPQNLVEYIYERKE
jgi:hypothetical protein